MMQRNKDNKDKNVKFEEKWLEFNDSIIRDFDKNKIAEECFGGN